MIVRIILVLLFVLGLLFTFHILRAKLRPPGTPEVPPLLPRRPRDGKPAAGLVIAGVALLLVVLSLVARGIGMAGGLFVLLAESLPYAFGALCFGLFVWWGARRRGD